MPADPSHDAAIARVRSLAADSRFWLQPFFKTDGDVLVELLSEVEVPLLRERVDLGLSSAPSEGGRMHYVAIGGGDLLALCAVVLDDTAQPGTIPLLDK